MAALHAPQVAGGHPASPAVPSADDVTFGRACMAFGLVTHEVLMACVADQQRLARQGRFVTLPQVLIGRQLITADQYHQVAERLRQRMEEWRRAHQHLQQQYHVPAPPPPLPPPPPDITASGRYSGMREKLRQDASDVLPTNMTAPVPQAAPVGGGSAICFLLTED